MVQGMSYLSEPIAAMEAVAINELPDLAQFLPRWIERLERESIPPRDWDTDRDRWLREAVTRTEGLAGLERLARSSRRPETLRAWCDAVAERGDWSRALNTYEAAAKLVKSAHWLGEFLDGAAIAAEQLGHVDFSKRLESAWRGAPSIERLLRWLGSDEPNGAKLMKRTTSALKRCPTKSARLKGVLYLLTGEVESAAKLLATAPGLGWSSEDHPGHVLFPAFAWVLGGAPNGSLRGGLARTIDRPPATTFHAVDSNGRDEETEEPDRTGKPSLSTPSLLQILQQASLRERLTQSDRVAMQAALRAAAIVRVDGVLREKRRRHYEHAAMLVGCCVEVDDAREIAIGSGWIAALRHRTSRFPAFQAALRRALAMAKT